MNPAKPILGRARTRPETGRIKYLMEPISTALADALERMATQSPLNADLLALARQVRG